MKSDRKVAPEAPKSRRHRFYCQTHEYMDLQVYSFAAQELICLDCMYLRDVTPQTSKRVTESEIKDHAKLHKKHLVQLKERLELYIDKFEKIETLGESFH